MTWGTVHGQVASVPGVQPTDFTFLQVQSIATASGIAFQFGDKLNVFRSFLIEVDNVEKPAGNNSFFFFQVSTNGATFESGAAYDTTFEFHSATSAFVATGATGSTSVGLTSAGGPVALTTSTGLKPAFGMVWIHGPGSGRAGQITAEWYFTNSASQPSMARGYGYFASATTQGILISSGNNFSGNARLYGVGLLSNQTG